MALREKTLKGIFWAFSQQFSVQLINFVLQFVLARILLPEDFGLIAMIQIFIAIGQSLMDGGMTSSLIRSTDVDQKDYSTVFFMNLMNSIVLYAILFFAAPYIADFFDQPRLIEIIRILTLSFVINAFRGVHSARLIRDLNFRLQMYMQLPASLIGGVLGVVLAVNGFGVWSLVWMKLATALIFMLEHWFVLDWRPTLLINRSKLKKHFNFGYKLTLSGLLTTIYNNSYILIIGKLFPPAELGFYSQADNLRMFPVRNITSALQRVTYPVFSAIQDDDSRMKYVFKKITAVVTFVIVPVMLLLTLLAEPLFEFTLTAKWLPAVPYFQILAVTAILYPLSVYNLNIILVKGKSGLHFRLEVLKKASSILFLLLIIPYGIYGAVYARAISMLIHSTVNIYFSGRLINHSLKEQFLDMLPIFLVGMLSMAVGWGLDSFYVTEWELSNLNRLILGVLGYGIVYVSLSLGFKLKCIDDLKELIQRDLLKKQQPK